MALHVAVQLYSVRDAFAADVRDTLQKVKDMGYEGVEFAGLAGTPASEMKKLCEEIGLVPLSAHVPYVDLVKDTEGVLAAYKEIGCPYVAIPYLTEEYRPGNARFPEVVENAGKIGAAAKALGMQLLYHNHDFEFAKIDGKYALEVLYDTVPADLLQTELDVCWVRVGGEEPAAYIRKFAGRAPIVHLKDYTGAKSADMYELIGIEKKPTAETGAFEFRPVGSGVQDFPSILAAAEDAGASWVVVEQDKATMGLTPMESIEKSRKYLQSIGY